MPCKQSARGTRVMDRRPCSPAAGRRPTIVAVPAGDLIGTNTTPTTAAEEHPPTMHPRNANHNVKRSCRVKKAKVGKMEHIAAAFGCSMDAVSQLRKDLLSRDDPGLWTRRMIDIARPFMNTPRGWGMKRPPNKSLYTALKEAVDAGGV